MSNALISFLVAISFATWIFTKQLRRSGQNTKSAVVVAGIAGVICFVVILTVVIMVDSSLNK